MARQYTRACTKKRDTDTNDVNENSFDSSSLACINCIKRETHQIITNNCFTIKIMSELNAFHQD